MIVVGTTLSAMAMSDPDAGMAWLYNAEALREQTGEDVEFFAAIQVDGRGLDPFGPLLARLWALDGSYWTFSLDDGRTSVNFDNRLRHITTGQNLVRDYAMSAGASHLLFMAADCAYPPDALAKLMALDVPVAGGHVPTYCLDGPRYAPLAKHGNVRAHMPTAAFVLLRRDFFCKVPWRWDMDAGMSDDPALYADALERGIQPVVHHDVVGRHYPECIGDYASRGYDTEVVR